MNGPFQPKPFYDSIVDSPSLEVFKARLDGVLGSLSWGVAALPMAGVENQ